LEARIDQFGVTQPNIQKLEGSDRILVELPGIKDPSRVQELIVAEAKLEFFETWDNQEVFGYLNKINDYLAKIKVVQGIDSTTTDTIPEDTTGGVGMTNPLDTTKTNDSDKVDTTNKMGGMGNEMTQLEREIAAPLWAVMQFPFYTGEDQKQQLLPGAQVGWCKTSDTSKVMGYLRRPDVSKMLPKELKLLWGREPLEGTSDNFALYALRTIKGKPALEGDVITSAQEEQSQTRGGFQVTMKMNSDGASQWATITKANIGKQVAIVLDDKVCVAPNVEGAITGGISSITGNYNSEDARALAAILEAGKLPVRMVIVEQAIVGPSLGQKAINAGLFSLLVAFLVILVYIAFFYGKAGITADLALFANLFFLIGALAAWGATLTLPGIAGLVLTIGMSVDSNVLIFERIKDELRHGKRLKIAIEDGYKKAYSAIIDANITLGIITLILMFFGAGPVKGFAVVLFVGILTSTFSSIFLTRLMFEFQLKKNWNVTFSTKPTENFMRNPKFNFVGKRRIFFAISLIITAIGVVSFFTKGFNLGIDLKGGRSYTVVVDNKNFTTQDIVNALDDPDKFGSAPIVKYYGSTDRVKIMTKYKYDEKSDTTVEKAIEKMIYDAVSPLYSTKPTFKDFTDKDKGVGLVESYIVGPTVASEVKSKSIWAIVLSLIMIFIYVLFRFKGWQFGLGALVALIHDVVVVLAVFSIFDGILPFSLEIDQAIIAAVLTVMGYSMNDTVIIFDRIREYLGEGKKGDMKDLINQALNSTLGRTINTSLNVFIVIIISFLFGGEGVKGFAFAMLIGILIGTYSSIFIATPIVVDLKKNKLEPAPVKK
jgi:SecD/SecF fusion protein